MKKLILIIIIIFFNGCGNNNNNEDQTINKAVMGTPIDCGYKFYTKNGNTKWFNGVKFLLGVNPNEYNNIAKFSYEGFKKVIDFSSSKKYFSIWFTRDWFENNAPAQWYPKQDIQEAMKTKIPLFIFYYFKDNMTKMPSTKEIEDYYNAAKTFSDFISSFKGKKIIVLQPEFNKNFIVHDENNSATMANIFAHAIDIIKAKNPEALFTLCMMDTGVRNAKEHLQKCGFSNCALGDSDEWEKSDNVYKHLVDKLDFISFQEMVSQFSRDPSNPGTLNNPNLISYSNKEIGIDYLSKRVENLTEFLHKKYNKPVILVYIGIASGTWHDLNNNSILEYDEFNPNGWNNKIDRFYKEMKEKETELYKKGLRIYIPMQLIDDPRHDIYGWQFFNINEYHLGLVSTSAKDEEEALYGDLKFKINIK